MKWFENIDGSNLSLGPLQIRYIEVWITVYFHVFRSERLNLMIIDPVWVLAHFATCDDIWYLKSFNTHALMIIVLNNNFHYW